METKRNLASIRAALMALALCLNASTALAGTSVTVDSPWVRSAPPTAKVMAGYLTITNHGAQTVTLTGAASPFFQKVEIHRTEIMQGMAHMTPVATLDIASHASATFEPNGYHLMLIGPERPLRRDDMVPLSLIFSDGAAVEFEAQVRDGPDDHGGHHHHH